MSQQIQSMMRQITAKRYNIERNDKSKSLRLSGKFFSLASGNIFISFDHGIILANTPAKITLWAGGYQQHIEYKGGTGVGLMSLWDTREGTSCLREQVGGGGCSAQPTSKTSFITALKFYNIIYIGSIHLFHFGKMSLHEKILSVKGTMATVALP